MNNVSLVGRLTKDPELKYTPSGVAVANFTLAINRPFQRDETDFIPIVVWRKQAENAANYLKKGAQAGVTGRIQVRSYDNTEGKKVYMTEVVAENVQFLDPKGNNTSNGDTPKRDPYTNNIIPDISDDDLPF